MPTPRRTKIISTLGPSTSDLATIKQLIQAGATLFRLNFSHGQASDHRQRADYIRTAAQELNTEVAIMADLQGPKIRVARFKNQKVMLKIGQAFILDSDLNKDAGDETQVGLDYKELPRDVHAQDKLLLDGGMSMPVPVDIVRQMGADIVLAVNLDGSYFVESEKKLNFAEIAYRSFNMLRYNLAEQLLRNADVVVTPKVGDVLWYKFVSGKATLTAGEDAMREQLPTLLKLL